MEVNWATIITAVVGLISTVYASKMNTKPTLDATAAETTDKLFQRYEKMNADLNDKVMRLETTVEDMRAKYESIIQEQLKEITLLKEENATLKKENRELRMRNK